jgi:hypothetical protein
MYQIMTKRAFLFYNAFGYDEDEQHEQMMDKEIIIGASLLHRFV